MYESSIPTKRLVLMGTFTPSLLPKGSDGWSCTFNENVIRTSSARKRPGLYRSTAKYAGSLLAVFMAVSPVIIAKFTIYYRCQRLTILSRHEWKTLQFFV